MKPQSKQDLSEMLEKHRAESKEYVSQTRRKDAGVKRDSYKHILPTKYRSYISRCNAKGIKFELSIEEFNAILLMPCAYCGSFKANSIDRIIAKDGYTEGNVAPCCTQCNMMKHCYSLSNFLSQVKQIHKYQTNNNPDY